MVLLFPNYSVFVYLVFGFSQSLSINRTSAIEGKQTIFSEIKNQLISEIRRSKGVTSHDFYELGK